jgi:cytochrome c-type biogenesis protein CcmH
MPLIPTFRAILAAAALAWGSAHAYTLEEFQFQSPAQEQEFRDLISKLRCLVCQNESLAGSQAELAQDLREEVYRMMQEGKGKDEIIEFLVARYGDFVLYQPPIKPSTYLLWFGPFVLVGVGGFLLLQALQRKKREPEPDLTGAERTRIDQLLTQPLTQPPTKPGTRPADAQDRAS